MSSIIIIGAGGHGKVVAELAELNNYTDISFADDKWPSLQKIGPWDICSTIDNLPKVAIICGIGNNATRWKIHEKFIQNGAPILKHPSSVISKYSNIEDGTVVAAGACINPFVDIGRGVIVNTMASIDHDCEIADFAHISPGARLSGNVSIGCRTWIGAGAVIKEGVKIGDDVIVGAGAVVLNDIQSKSTMIGNPAKEQQNVG